MNSRIMTLAELRRRLAIVIDTRQPAMYTIQKLTGIDKTDLKRYHKGVYGPSYENRLVLSDLFRKMDLGIYELYQRPFKRGKGMVWDLRVSSDPRPTVAACVTFTRNGPKLRFKSTAELLGYEKWQPRENASLLSSKLIESSKSIVV